MKGCELCSGVARVFCESDQAMLCFDCDGKVHGANFLVARHARTLLCRSCQSPTPWKAAGPKLGPTFSVCERCVLRSERKREGIETEQEGEQEGESAGGNDDNNSLEEEEEEEDDDDDEEEEEEEEEEDGDNQVVPWSATATPPPVASSSSSDESSGQNRNGFLKRMRESNVDLASQGPSTSGTNHPIPLRNGNDDEATSESYRPSKVRKPSETPPESTVHLVSSGSARPPI